MAFRLLPDLFQQTITVNGQPAVGYVLKSYIYNTTTPSALYTNSAGSASATSFTLNSRGAPQSASGTEISLYGDTNQTAGYKIVLEDADGAVVRTYEGPVFPASGIEGATTYMLDSVADLKAASPAATIDQVYVRGYHGSWADTSTGPVGGAYWHRTGSTGTAGTGPAASNGRYSLYDATGAQWELSRSQGLDILKFGARVDGTTDCSTVFQDAATYQRFIKVPGGYRFRIDAPIYVGYDTSILGDTDNYGGSIILVTGDSDTFVCHTSPDSGSSTTTTRNRFKNLRFMGYPGETVSGDFYCINLQDNAYMHRVEDCVFGDALQPTFGQMKGGVKCTGGSVLSFVRVISLSQPTTVTWTGYALHLTDCIDVNIDDCQFERGGIVHLENCNVVSIDSAHCESQTIEVIASMDVSIRDYTGVDCRVEIDERSIVHFDNYQQINTELYAHPAAISFENSRPANGPRSHVTFNPTSEFSPVRPRWNGAAYNSQRPWVLPETNCHYLALVRFHKTTVAASAQTATPLWVENGTGTTIYSYGSVTLPAHVGASLTNNETHYPQAVWCSAAVISPTAGQLASLDTTFEANIWAAKCLNDNPNFVSDVAGWSSNPTSGLSARTNCTVAHDAVDQQMVITPTAAGAWSVTQWPKLPDWCHGKNVLLCIQGEWDDLTPVVVSNNSAHNGGDGARSFGVEYVTESGKKICWVLCRSFNTNALLYSAISIGGYTNNGTDIVIDWAAMVCVDPDADTGYSAEITLTSLDTTPSLAGGNYFVTANAGATTITVFDDMKNGQEKWVRVNDANTTLDLSGTTMKGNNGSDYVAASGDMLHVKMIGGNQYITIIQG